MTSQPDTIMEALQLAVTHHQAGRIRDAEIIYKQVLKAEPENEHANHFLGIIASQAGKNELAVEFISKAIAKNPAEASYLLNLGNVFRNQNNLPEALAAYQKALALKPDFPEAHYNLGLALQELGRLEEAVASYRQAIKLNADYAKAYNGLGIALRKLGRLDEAAAAFRQVLRISPGLASANNNLGNVFLAQGHLPEALATYRQALAAKQDYSLAHSNILMTLNYFPDITQEDIYRESLQWADQHASRLLADEPLYENTRDRERKLRIGYVSPDFRDHSVASFFEPVLRAHDREAVEVFCYTDVRLPDAVTGRLQSQSDHWLSITGLADAAVASQIRTDAIDILVDLSGHTQDNRLLVFARKPAPVEVSWLGYPNTTGMKAVDYRLTDAIADPAGTSVTLHSESLIRLQGGFLCYQPEESAPDVTGPPCQELGYITFGSFNNLTKLNLEVVRCWAEILHLVKDSRLLLKSKHFSNEAIRSEFMQLFAAEGIAADRLELYGWMPYKHGHLELYNRLDIGLDPFPYNGTTTTCEALWMGVPVLTLSGDRHSCRVGASIMHQIGFDDLVVKSGEDYVNAARALADDRESLQETRSQLRTIMQESPLMDSRSFVQDLEDAYRQMWHKWCENGK